MFRFELKLVLHAALQVLQESRKKQQILTNLGKMP